jgi:hypothetical protein
VSPLTTSMTPTHGDPLRHGSRSVCDGDPERWLPDPSWPVPPRGWQLWAAAGSSARPGRAGDVGVVLSEDESMPRVGASMDHTVDVKSDMRHSAVLEDASFTLPARPSALVDHERVDLLADRPTRRAPEGALAGFAVFGALVLFSCLVGGLTGGLIVIGVSTLLAASAALVRGHLSLSQVGGQRGAGLLLGTAVAALIVGSVATHERRSGVELLPSAPVPVSSVHVTDHVTAYAAVPPAQSAPSVEPPRSGEPVGGRPLTLEPDALSPEAAAPSGGRGSKGPTVDQGSKGITVGKDSKASKGSTKGSSTSKDAKTKGAKTKGAKAKGAKAKGAGTSDATASAPSARTKGAALPTLSDAGIGGSGAATTSVSGFSANLGTRAGAARHPGVAILTVR